MGKLHTTLIFLLLLLTAVNAAAQNNVSDALSRMERAVNTSQEEFSMRDIYFLGRAVAAHLLNHFPHLNQEQRRISQSLESGAQEQLFSAAVGAFVESLFSSGYSQLQEFEADSTAFSLLVLAGYNPASLLELFEALGRLQGEQTGSLNSTHPLPSQRVANLQRQMNAYRGKDDSGVRRERFMTVMGSDK